MPSFGENLRREREKRNISLEQISQSTKIGTRMLQALEEEKFNQLPGGIFNRGFVRAYARHLGLDDDQAVADYMEASGEAPHVLPELPVEEPVQRLEATADGRQRPVPWGVFAAILLLLALALSIWSHRQKKHQGNANPPSPEPPAAQRVLEDHPARTDNLPASTISSSSDSNPITPTPIPSTLSPAAQVTPTSAAVRSPATVPSTTPGEATIPLAPGEFVVVIHAREASWTAIVADGRTVYSGMLSTGDQRAIRSRKEVIVKAGNVGGIDLSFNGKKLDPQGDRGQVRTLTFGAGGMVSNTPATPPIQ